jgi:hypothetical protein
MTNLIQEKSKNYWLKPNQIKSKYYRQKPEKARMIDFIQEKNTIEKQE